MSNYLKNIWDGAAAPVIFFGSVFALIVGLHYFGADDKINSPYQSMTDPVVKLTGEGVNGHGSGVLIANNIILTARHVAEHLPVTAVNVRFSDGTEVIGQTLFASVGTDLDLAVIRIPEVGIKPARITCRMPVHGEDVVVVGYPLSANNVVLKGIVAALDLPIEENGEEKKSVYSIIQAPVNPGNSGGPAYDSRGNLLGIVTAYLTAPSGWFGSSNSGLGLIQPTYKYCDLLGLK